MSRSTDLARVGGFHNGEGSVFYGSGRSLTLSLSQSSDTGIPEDLLFAQRVLGGGYINGPQHRGPGVKPEYKYRLYGKAMVMTAVKRLWPYLSSVKQAQAANAIAKVSSVG